ncbi:tetratricopeptide repeat protein [Parasulfuritortus cantonensis]|uniref:protein O-GlcNAc transferase n=1 Tax=Parasulfuritortus cantonensis TaxID=2528202 RepID=A0A4R1B434_9PROT|nr:tetratricopeptide repeat protein [Parasulfuritortus cantonensis]TCJ12844.1 tetratricopeptide repeat protein [Parasulfuritortus cantonensis]
MATDKKTPGVEQLLARAERHARKNEIQLAAQAYQEVLARYPRNERAARGLAALRPPPPATATATPAQADLNALIALYNQGRLQEAQARLRTLLARYPGVPLLHNLQGAIAGAAGRFADAAASYRQALALAPEFAEAHCNLGNALLELGRHAEAIESLERALLLRPTMAEAHYNLGVAWQALNGLDRAIAHYGQALQANPGFAKAQYNLGNAYKVRGDLDEAAACFRRVLAIDPNVAEAHYNLGVVLQEQKRLDEAIDCYDRAVARAPQFTNARAALLILLGRTCAWHRFGASLAELTAGLAIAANDKQAVPPFGLLSLATDPGFQRHAAECYSKANFGRIAELDPFPAATWQTPINVGYFSADFHNHATMYLMARLFAVHDRARFRIHAYSFGPDCQDAMRAHLVDNVDVFHDVRKLDDEAVARLARHENIHIAVDLKGFTEHARTGIFARRAAPIQVSYLGYPGTMASPFMDYLVADPVVIPAEERAHYSERIIYLPHSYQVNDDRRPIAATTPTRAECGLPDSGFVFCCFNHNYKISPDAFAIWMRLLARVPGSVLWLLRLNRWAEANLRAEAVRHGIDADRLVFAERVELPEHLARHRLADLFLDTFNYNAHTTASDALWAGLPMVTCMGRSFPSRVGASLLHALDLPELVTADPAAYEALAWALASEPERLQAVRAKLQANLASAPLFDALRFTRTLESAYEAVYRRHVDGLAPADLDAPDAGPA